MAADSEAEHLRERAAALREMAREPVPSRVAGLLMQVAATLEKRAARLVAEPRLSDVLGGGVTKQMMGADGVQRQHVERVMRTVKRRRRSQQ